MHSARKNRDNINAVTHHFIMISYLFDQLWSVTYLLSVKFFRHPFDFSPRWTNTDSTGPVSAERWQATRLFHHHPSERSKHWQNPNHWDDLITLSWHQIWDQICLCDNHDEKSRTLDTFVFLHLHYLLTCHAPSQFHSSRFFSPFK